MTVFWTLTAILVLVPALLIGLSPTRWLGRVILLWLTSPLVGYFAVVIWEATTRPTIPGSTGSALLGLSLISAILLVPWLVVSIFGIALGFTLRIVVKPSDTPEPGDQRNILDKDTENHF